MQTNNNNGTSSNPGNDKYTCMVVTSNCTMKRNPKHPLLLENTTPISTYTRGHKTKFDDVTL